jgi:hypothetical protein
MKSGPSGLGAPVIHIALWVTRCSRLGFDKRHPQNSTQYQVSVLLARAFRGHHSKFQTTLGRAAAQAVGLRYQRCI